MVACRLGSLRNIAVVVFLCLAGATQAENVRERLNKIFYWQLADDLKLSPQQEKAMIVIIEDIQKRRTETIAARDSALDALKKNSAAKTPASSEKELARYRDSLSRLAGLDIEEYDRLQKLLGAETLARFYVVREDLLSRVRDSLKSADGKK